MKPGSFHMYRPIWHIATGLYEVYDFYDISYLNSYLVISSFIHLFAYG
jgi:hypothetical protein